MGIWSSVKHLISKFTLHFLPFVQYMLSCNLLPNAASVGQILTTSFSLKQDNALKMATLTSSLPDLYILKERQNLVLHMCNQKYFLQKSCRMERSYSFSLRQNFDAKHQYWKAVVN